MKIYVSFTFDDGKKSYLKDYYPILKKFGFPASFYIITDQIGLKGRFDLNDLIKLYKEGNEIGSHTHTHRSLPILEEKEINDELNKSKIILKRFNVQTLSYPFGDYNQKVIKIIQKYYLCARACGDIAGKEDDMGFNTEEILPFKLKTIPLNKDFFKKIKSKKKNIWLIFTIHEPPQVTLSYCFWFLKSHFPKPIDFLNLFKNLWRHISSKEEKRNILEEICSLLKENKAEVLTVKKAIKIFRKI